MTLSNTVVTIREAAWLTDDAYSYDEVIRTMGEIISLCGGHLRTVTHSDVLDSYMQLAQVVTF